MPSIHARQPELGGGKFLQQPRSAVQGRITNRRFPPVVRPVVVLLGRPKRNGLRPVHPFDDHNPVVCRKIPKGLDFPAGPFDLDPPDPLLVPEAEPNPAGALRQETRSDLDEFRPGTRIGLDGDFRSHRVPVAARAPEVETGRVVATPGLIPQQPELRRISILQNEIQVAVLVEIADGEGSPVFGEVQSRDARGVGKSSVAAVDIEIVGLA